MQACVAILCTYALVVGQDGLDHPPILLLVAACMFMSIYHYSTIQVDWQYKWFSYIGEALHYLSVHAVLDKFKINNMFIA